MKKTLLSLLLFLAISTLLCGCKKDKDVETKGSIYGVVADKATGEPIKNAGVKLNPLGLNTVTGSEGQFEFISLEDGEYSLIVTQYGYKDETTSTIIVNGGKSMQYDVQIDRISAVKTLYASEITPTTAVLNAKLLNNDLKYTEIGFVYGTMPTPSLSNGALCVSSSSVQLGDFSEAVSGLTRGTTYYVRAFAKNKEKVSYGNTCSFVADNCPYVVLQESNMMVQKEDMGEGDWNSAKLLCENSTLGGFTDWRLPTKDELMVIYNNRSVIGGFANESYWSSDYYGQLFDELYGYQKSYYFVNFKNGNVSNNAERYTNYVRAVCSIDN